MDFVCRTVSIGSLYPVYVISAVGTFLLLLECTHIQSCSDFCLWADKTTFFLYFIHFIFVIFLASEIQTGPRPINTIHIDYTVLPYSKEQIHFENSISPAMLTRLVIQRSDHYVLQRNRTIFWTSLGSFTQFFFVFTAVCFYIQYLNEILRCDLISHSNWTQEWK